MAPADVLLDLQRQAADVAFGAPAFPAGGAAVQVFSDRGADGHGPSPWLIANFNFGIDYGDAMDFNQTK